MISFGKRVKLETPRDQSIKETLFTLFLNKVLQEEKIPGDASLVKALTTILTASQRYMRDQTVGQAF